MLTEAFWFDTLGPTVGRAAGGALLAAAVALPIGFLAGYSRLLNGVVEPIRFTLSALPAPVFAVLALLWFGANTFTVIVIVATMLMPLFFVAARDGLNAVNGELTEMAWVYRIHWRAQIQHIVLPAVVVSLVPATRIAAANALRLAILAEIILAIDGMGEQISLARQYLQTESLFALIAVLVAVIALFEWCLSWLIPQKGRSP
ncbi:MAG: ABC transporter permease subunit [Pseudomonadota bacterium]